MYLEWHEDTLVSNSGTPKTNKSNSGYEQWCTRNDAILPQWEAVGKMKQYETTTIRTTRQNYASK